MEHYPKLNVQSTSLWMIPAMLVAVSCGDGDSLREAPSDVASPTPRVDASAGEIPSDASTASTVVAPSGASLSAGTTTMSSTSFRLVGEIAAQGIEVRSASSNYQLRVHSAGVDRELR